MPAPEARIENLLQDISDKLSRVIGVLSIQATADKSTTDAARALKLAGLDNQTIADVLNTTPATVRALTANLRKR